MPLTRQNLRQIINVNNGGDYHSEYGPTTIAGKRIWEIWVQQDGLFENRFIVETPLSGDYYDSFQTFAPALDSEIRDQQSNSPKSQADIHLLKFKAYVAALVFLIALGGILYIAFARNESNAIVTTLLGVVASGSAFFFGRWTPAT
jgi:hypothetical protein